MSGCPPLQGTEGGEQNFVGVLETAMKLANQDADADADEEPQKVVSEFSRTSRNSASDSSSLCVCVAISSACCSEIQSSRSSEILICCRDAHRLQ